MQESGGDSNWSIFSEHPDTVFELCRHLGFEDLYNMGLVSKLVRRVSRSYFTHEQGMRIKVLDYIKSLMEPEVFDALLRFHAAAKAIITGSALLKFFQSQTTLGWPAFFKQDTTKRFDNSYFKNQNLVVRDLGIRIISFHYLPLDMMVPLNEASVSAFKAFLQEIKSHYRQSSGHDSLSASSFHTGHSAVRQPLSKEEKDAEVKERVTFEKTSRELTAMIELDDDSYDYTKHVRSVYFKVSLNKSSPAGECDFVESIDFVFLPEVDLAKYSSICDWMQYNFDLQICANAITSKSLFSLAPHEIISQVAFMRMDQYCLNIVEDEEFEESYYELDSPANQKSPSIGNKFFIVHPQSYISRHNSHRWSNVKRCECYCIIYNRIKKYMMRGYHFIYGTQREYCIFESLKWRRVNVVEDEEVDLRFRFT